MKNTGLTILIFGLLKGLFNGFCYATTETVIEIGNPNFTADKTIRANWGSLLESVVCGKGYVLGGREG